MNHRARFKTAISMACSHVGIRESTLDRQCGVRDFELDADFSSTPQDIAADALDELTRRDGEIFDRAICLAIVEFLDKTAAAPKEDPNRTMRMRALAEVLMEPGTRQAFFEWASTWYD